MKSIKSSKIDIDSLESDDFDDEEEIEEYEEESYKSSNSNHNEYTSHPKTWKQALIAEDIEYKYQSQLTSTISNYSKNNTIESSTNSFDSILDQMKNINNWEKFITFEKTLKSKVDAFQEEMRKLVAQNYSTYVSVEDFIRTQIRDQSIIDKQSWIESSTDLKKLDEISEDLLQGLFQYSDDSNKIKQLQSLMNGKWKNVIFLKHQLDLALLNREYSKVIPIYRKMFSYRSKLSSSLFEDNYFKILDQVFIMAQTQIFDRLLNSNIDFYERENYLRILRDLDVTNPNPDQSLLVFEYLNFKSGIFEIISKTKNLSLNEQMETATRINENTNSDIEFPLYIFQSIRRKYAIHALNKICKYTEKFFLVFFKFCNIIQYYPSYQAFRKKVLFNYPVLLQVKNSQEEQASFLKLMLYNQTHNPAFLSDFDPVSNAKLYRERIETKNINKVLQESNQETQFDVILLSQQYIDKIRISVNPTILADDFISLCIEQLQVEDASEYHLIVDKDCNEIIGPTPLCLFQVIESGLKKIQNPELFFVHKSLISSPRKKKSFHYENILDILSIQNMIDDMGFLFQNQCLSLFNIIDTGESYQPQLFSLMEKAISTSERCGDMITESNLNIQGLNNYPKQLRLFALNIAVGRYISEIKTLSESETWELIGKRTATPDLFSAKCRSFIYLTKSVVSLLEKKQIISDFIKLFDTYLGEYEKMSSDEFLSINDSNVHISEQPFFTKLMIILANLSYTQKDIISSLSKLFEESFSVSINSFKKSLTSRVEKCINLHVNKIINLYAGKMKSLTFNYMEDLKSYLPLNKTESDFRNTLPAGGMNIVMRFNITVFNELTLLYSRVEELSLYEFNLLNEVIKELTLFIKENSRNYICEDNKHLIHAQIIVWKDLFISTRKHDNEVVNVMKNLFDSFPSMKLQSQFTSIIQKLLIEYPYFIEN